MSHDETTTKMLTSDHVSYLIFFLYIPGSHFIRFSDDNKRVQIGSRIPSTGEAFIITGSRLLECHQGPDHRRLSRGISADEV